MSRFSHHRSRQVWGKLRIWSFVLAAVLFAAAPIAGSKPDVRFAGLREMSESDARAMIEQQLALIAKGGASPALADDAAFFLERAMRSRGFPDADVVPEFNAATRALTLKVAEGNQRRLGKITLDGNEADVPEAELRALVTRATANRSSGFGLGKKAMPYVQRDLESGLADVATYYQSLGYLDATVAPLAHSIGGAVSGEVPVHVEIKAGPRYQIGEIVIGGGDTGADAELGAALAAYKGEPATTENISAARVEVVDHYRRLGHYKSEVELRSQRKDGVLDLQFEVLEGRPFVVGEVHFEGNERIDTGFLGRRFSALEGRPYSAAKTETIYRELLSTGMLNTISIVPEERGMDTVDLRVSVSEAKTREIAVVGGYGSFEGGIVGASLRERNLFGRGRQLGAQAELTGRGVSGDITYSDRWFFETPLRFESSLFSVRKELEGYEKFESGLRGELLWPVGEHFSVGAFAQFSFTDIFDAQIADEFLGDRTYRLGTLGVSASYDTRDDPVNPRSGLRVTTTLEHASQAFGSEIDFLRGTVRFTQHIPVGRRSELRLGARSGFTTGTGDTEEIPIDLRFFSGGSTSVRSFDERRLGAGDGRGHPVGGEFYSTFNAEFTFPLMGILRGATFADAGNLIGDLGDAGFGDMHYAAGLGLRLDLPTGPVRLDYGWNLNRGNGEPGGAFHVSVGLAF